MHEGITLEVVEMIARSAKMPFECRPIDRTELLIADEIALCGTLAELVPVKSIDGLPLDPNTPILKSLQDRFFRVVRNLILSTT